MCIADIQMIEADVIIGVHNNESVKITDPANATLEQPKIPIMGHPPSNSSDLSFEQFLTKVIEFNTKNTTKKGIKLDFKSIEAVEQSMPILKTHWKDVCTFCYFFVPSSVLFERIKILI